MLLADTLRVQHSTITCEAQGFKFKFWEIDHTAAEEDIVVMFPVREHRVSQSGHSPCAPGPREAVPADCRPDPARRCQIGDWEEWQICSHSCGSGERKRSRSILIPAADNGPPCDDETEEVEPCNTQACHMTCIDCLWSEWSMWSDCSHCGHQRYRHRGVMRQANHCGRKCDAQAAKEVGYCKSACLEHYCTWSTWQEMGGCSAQCGPSTRLLQRHLVLTTTEPQFEVARIGDRGGLCRDARGESYSGCPVQAISEEECRNVLHTLQDVNGVQGAMFDDSRVVKFGARRCFVLVDPNIKIWKQDVPGGWLDTPCIAGTGRGPIASAGSDGADKWMCLSLENRPLAKGDESMPCSGEQFYQSTCDSSTKCRVECSPVDCVLTEWSAWSEPTCTELCERTRTVARSNEPEAWSLWNLLQDVPLSYFVFLCYARQESQEVFSSEITWGGRAAFGLKCF
eukprot:s2309_g10.t1